MEEKNEGASLSIAPTPAEVKDAIKACYQGAYKDIERFFPYIGREITQLIALSIASSWVHRAFDKMPLLHLTGVKGSGKSTLIQIAVLHGGAKHTMNPTIAVLYRTNAHFLCIDECERIDGQITTVLNASHQRGIKVERVGKIVDGVGAIDSFEPYKVTWLAGIKSRFPASLESRCIKIGLKPIFSEHDSSELFADESPWYIPILQNYHRMVEGEIREAYQSSSLKTLRGRFKDCYRALLSLSVWLELETKPLHKHIQELQRAEITDEDYTPDQIALIARLESRKSESDELVLFGWISEPFGGRVAYPRVREALDGLGFTLRKKTALGSHVFIDKITLDLHIVRSQGE
jgi:hypothetical protein